MGAPPFASATFRVACAAGIAELCRVNKRPPSYQLKPWRRRNLQRGLCCPGSEIIRVDAPFKKMKTKIIFIILVLIVAVVALVAACPRKNSVLKIIDARMATRSFSDRSLDDKTTGEILWAAFGKNSRGTRTIPTAKNEQNLKVYAIRADGAFLYDGERLDRVSDTDLRPLFARQDFVLTAPLTLLFVGSDREFSPMHAGSSYQNVALYCAEHNLGNVVRAYFDKPGIEKALGLSPDEFAIISQTIGWKE